MPPKKPDESEPLADEVWTIEVDHSQYYRWLPVRDEEVTDEQIAAGEIVDATWPGYKMRRSVIKEPTTTTVSVHVPTLRKVNEDRREAGLAAKPDHANLTRHLEDGPLPKHLPLESVTAIRCSNPAIEKRLMAYFVGGDE